MWLQLSDDSSSSEADTELEKEEAPSPMKHAQKTKLPLTVATTPLKTNEGWDEKFRFPSLDLKFSLVLWKNMNSI